jgi:hypothetical protein
MINKLTDLFFPVERSQVLVNKNVVDKYYAITKRFDQSFLGIKRIIHSLMENEAAYLNSLRIYQLLSETEGNAFNWWMNEVNNQCAVIVSNQRMDQFALVFKDPIFDSMKKEYPQIDKLRLFDDSLKVDGFNSGMIESQYKTFVANKLSKLDLAVAFVNGYDIDYNCNYYLIIRWIDNDEKIKYLAISRATPKNNHYKIADHFRKELINFIVTSFKRYITPIDKKYIRPILFNIYNKNIESTTIQNDDDYRQNLFDFNHSTVVFVNHLKEYNYYAFTEFIIRNCYMYEGDKLNLRIRNKDSVISVNETYHSSISRLINLYSNNKNRSEFEFSNFYRLEGVEHLLER